MAQTLQFQLQLVDKLSGPAMAGASALKAVEKQMRAVKASSQAIVPQRPIAVGSAAADKAAAAAAIQAEKAANKAKIAEARAAAQQLKTIERQRAADKRAAEKTAAAESRAAAKAATATAKAAAKEQSLAAKESAKAVKAAEKEAAKAAKQKAAEVKAAGEGFAAEAAAMGAAASAAAVAVLALGAAFVAAAVGGASLALAASEAKGDTLDMLEAMLGTQEAALGTYDAIQDITRDVALSQSRAQDLAQSLTAAGVTNQAMLLDAIKSIGQVDSVIKGAGDKVQAIIETANTAGKFQINAKKLVGTGVQMQALFENIAAATGKGVKQVEAELKAGKISAEVGVAALTKTIDQKFGTLAGKQLLDLGSQMQRFQDNIGRLFEDVDTGPFLEALKSVLDLFDQSTESGRFLKSVITSTFDALFQAVAAVAPYVKVLFKGLIIIALQSYIAMKPLLKALGLIGSTSQSSGGGAKQLANAMVKVGEVVGAVVGIFSKFLAHKAVLVVLAGAAIAVALPFVLMQGILLAAAAAFTALAAAGAYALDWLLTLGEKAWEAGGALVSGLIDGVSGAASKLIQAVKNLGGQALSAFKSVFKIASPSKVMAGMGENLSLGLAQGIMAGAPAVNDNMAAVVEPVAPPSVGSAQASKGASASTSIHGVNITINIHGVSNSEDLKDDFPDIIADAFEKLNLTQGLQPAA